MDAGELRCKGTNLKGVSDALARLEGPSVYERMVVASPPDLRALLRAGVKTGAWYDVKLYRELHAAINQVVLRPGISRALAREATRHDFRGMFRLFITVFKPETVLAHSVRLWRLYCSGGEVQARKEGPGRAVMTYTGLVGFDRHLFQDSLGGTEAVLEVAGAEQIVSEVLTGGRDGDTEMTARITWRP